MTQGQQIERLTLSVSEAADLLGLGRNSAYEAVRQGKIPSIRVGARFLIPRAALLKSMGESTELSLPQASIDMRIIAEELNALATDFRALSERLALAAKRIHPQK